MKFHMTLILALSCFLGGSVFASYLVIKIAGLKSPEIKILSVPKGQIAIDPNQTNCKRAKQGFELNGWFTVTEIQEDVTAARVGRGELQMKQLQTLHCKFIELGEIKQDFYLYENWYAKVKR